MSTTIPVRVDNISFFEQQKPSHSVALFTDKDKETKPGLLRTSLEKVTGFMQQFSVVQVASSKTRKVSQFLVFFCIACALFLFALSSLPMILIFPEKFALLFSLASIALHVALSCLKENLEEYLKALVADKDYSTVSTVYGVSLLFTLYSSLYLGSYVVVLVACGLQMASVAWLMFSMFPRGSNGVLTIVRLGLRVCPGSSILQV